ncbi:MAG: hypothetical protein WAK03_14345 [Methylocystis sp.]|jgi:hypothetical protein
MMSYLQGVVYPPPSSDYPPVVIIFKSDGEILAARAAASMQAAESFLHQVLEEVKSQLDENLTTSPQDEQSQ